MKYKLKDINGAPPVAMEGVKEYSEGLPLQLISGGGGRMVILAFNEGGFNNTQIDVETLLDWLLKNGYITPVMEPGAI